jgi:fumarate reductase subunit D
MPKTIAKNLFGIISLALPILAFAASKNFKEFVVGIIGIFNNSVIPVIFGLVFVFLLYGILKYIISAGDEKKVEEAKKTVFYGIIAIFIMLSFWGLVSIITSSFSF